MAVVRATKLDECGDHLVIEGEFGSGRQMRAITLENPTVGSYVAWFTDDGFTVDQLNVVLLGGTSPSVTFRIDFGADASAPGTSLIVAGTVVTNTTTGDEITVFDNATIPAGSWVVLEVTASTGTGSDIADFINVTLHGE